ncbi:MAG: GTPase [Ruminococcaceae bacterium]|nr:GTPase [Oscillospiraceae bacterium]
MAAKLPVYLFTGFLEGGKTHIIQESMEDQKFNSGEKTLIIQCEEGVDELDLSRFWGQNVYLERIEDEADFTKETLTALAKKHKLDRVIIEYNGMWMLSTLYENLPDNWAVYQEMMFADANTFLSYNANMRQLMVDKLQGCEMLVLNRTPEGIDKDEIHKVVRGVSRSAAITYDYPDGHVEYDDIEDPLPYDLDADVVNIADQDYAVFYRDLSEDMSKYAGKTIRFKGIVARDGANILAGRHVMTCCADDIAYHPLVCIFRESTSLKTRDWVTLTGKIRVEKHKLYRGMGPVLYVESTEFAVKPAQEVATFY